MLGVLDKRQNRLERGEKPMSMDKGIIHHKEHRKPYRGAKAVSKACRNHGSCDWCRDNRLYQARKELSRTDLRRCNVDNA